MNKQRVLIVDDEEAVLTVLKHSLEKINPAYQVVTVTDGFAALNQVLEAPFDVVVTDYNMSQMDGLELTEAIRYASPDTRIIMITAYGHESVEEEARRLQTYRYLTKPLQIQAFRQIVQQALSESGTKRNTILTLSDTDHQRITQRLEQLRGMVGARCIFFTAITGHMMARVGDTDQMAVENIISLLGAGMATLTEAGRMMDNNHDAVNLTYHEGQQEDFYALNIGQHHLLTLVISRGPYSSRLGSVWYHARQAAGDLTTLLTRTDTQASHPLFDDNFDQAFDSELDKLFGSDGF